MTNTVSVFKPNPDPGKDARLAAERMEAAFDSIPFNPDMFRITGSVTDEDMHALSEPPATLPPQLVARFVRKVGTTWGGPDDLRRITARALTLAADFQLPLDRGLLWTKLAWADWTNWPTYQTATVREFLRCEFRRLISSEPRPAHVAHRWLRDAAYGSSDLDVYLDEWRAALEPTVPFDLRRATIGHLVLLLSNSPLRPDFPETIREVFPGNSAAALEVLSWLIDQRTVDQLEQAAVALAETSDARRVLVALDRLRRLQVRATGSEVPSA